MGRSLGCRRAPGRHRRRVQLGPHGDRRGEAGRAREGGGAGEGDGAPRTARLHHWPALCRGDGSGGACRAGLRTARARAAGRPLAVRRAAVLRAVGTSGTVNTLVAMARAARGEDLGRLHGASASARELRRLRRRILAADAAKRSGLAGIDTKRVDLMPAAAVLLDFILARAGAPTLVACTWALREGLLLDLARLRSENAGGAPARRRRSVEALAARFAGPNPHGRHVARLALSLFDAVAPALALPPPARELLEYAALLHDIGHAIDHDRHHRHSCYLIQNAELLGLERVEVETIAQVARGHRKQAPKPSDLGALPPRLRQVVRGLAALLRVADALDRTHSAA